MGQPADRVALFAGLALPVLHNLAERFGAEAMAPTKHVRGKLFRGTPLERDVDCVPVERMADLVGVLAAKRWPASVEQSDASAAKTELTVLAVATFGPAAAAAGKVVGGALWEVGKAMGAKMRERIRSRRATR
jgi:hypothetical protein